MLLGEIFGHKEYVIERFARPVGVAEFFDGEKEHAAAKALQVRRNSWPFS